jgi:secretion/DNA translocation related TadE-like protein
MSARIRNEDGIGSPVMLALLVLAALFCLVTADAANGLAARGRAQSAADAAALAAATAQWPFLGSGEEPEDAAEAMAEANGAELISCECPLRGEEAVVVVAVSTRIRLLGVAPPRVRARALAAVDPGAVFRGPDTSR